MRVRFAPSPTGMFHVGSARSALSNWLHAKRYDGAFVLRIEDTDAARNRPEWTEGIISALEWIGIAPGAYEGPFFQSENVKEHTEAALRLYERGSAYYCDCTREAVLERTDAAHRGYDGHCRDRGLDPAPGRALRFRTPREGATVVRDLVRGEPAYANDTIEDFVLVRGDGSVLFLLANVVDDKLQGITHVLRAEEHLSNTPKQQLLWEALGATPPVWGHLPLLVNEKRQKLSKRRDKVSLESYRAEGYLADAMRNYLMLLGWSPPGDEEIVPWSVIEETYRVEDVNPSPAFFDERKLRAFNGEYIRALPEADFAAACEPWLIAPTVPWRPDAYDRGVFRAVAGLAQTRVAVLSEIVGLVDFLFLDIPEYDETSWARAMQPPAAAILAEARAAFADCDFEPETLKATLERVGATHELKLGKAQAPVRVAVTGRSVGLPLFESLAVLGRDRTLARLAAAIDRL